MRKITVYDKASWHLEGTQLTGLEHLKVVMDWLKQHNLLSDAGLEVYELGVDQEFSLTSEMVTDEGKKLLDENYKDWTRVISANYISCDLLDHVLSSIGLDSTKAME
ncbi:hypothetical protein MJ257_12305 [Paenibacillus timonensis]|uniref:Uncharacterized protein n=1 Tax=Paenibacillus timonensis TaxID=225915 RepID=A0ABW3SC29_9BACL|nr:hypothetical protein [Paenibacillus timonensis]EBK2060126.1 hypothetical protein [Salmonella enterica subsp. enterica serovar Typhi]MCH1640889.1 hypothetical protein [Paenibacillus timonensis]